MKMSIILQGLVWWLVGLSVAIAQVQDGEIIAPQSDSLVSQGGTGGLEAVHAVVNAAGSSSSQALVSQIQIGNVMEEGLTASLAIVRDSFQNNRGIIGANQNSGNLNNQANVHVIAHNSVGPTIQLEHAAIEQRLEENTIVTSGTAREDRIQDSFGGTVGIVGINQSAGNLNNQANVIVITLGMGSEFVPLEDSSLGAVNSGNKLIPGPPGPKSDVILDSFAGFRGLAQVSQSAGDLNSVSNKMNISFSAMTLK
ncbi:MAG: hypothetical protein E8D41_00475 [Nitrospira sp.]|nr:MAG: hypothetical protein E8D41_00475 [Nitrospira sp.]